MGYSDIREKHLNGSTDESKDESSKKKTYKKPSKNSTYESLMNRYGIKYDIDEDYINSFISDSNAYISTANDEFNNVGWGNAKTLYDSRRNSYEDLESRATVIRRWVDSNSDKMDDETYSNYIGMLEQVNEGISSVYKAFRQTKKFYNQFDSEAAYNEWKKAEDEKQALLESEDFEEKSRYVSTVYYRKSGKPQFGDETYEYINNKNIRIKNRKGEYKGRERARSIIDHRLVLTNTEEINKDVFEEYHYLEPEEVAIYNYYYNTQGKEKAEQYLQSLSNILAMRQGAAIALEFDGSALEPLISVQAGFDNAITGLANIYNYATGNEGLPPTYLQYAQSELSSNNEGVWKVVNDLANTTGNMLPSIVVGAITHSPLLGSLTLGGSAMGNAYAEMRNQGYGEREARNYATMVGASEVVLQYLIGGIGKLGGKLSGKAIANFISGIDNAYARVAIQVGGKMASEGLEELIQTAAEPVFKLWATGEEFEAAEWSDIWYSALLGALSSLGLDGAPTMVGTAINSHQANKLYGDNVEDIVNESLEIDPENAHAQRMRSRLDNGKKVGGYQINRLFEANRESLLSQDTKKIKNAALRILGAYGETSDVTKVADVITKFAKGEKLTSKDYNILNESKYGHQVVTEINQENIKSGGLKNKWAEELGTKLIHPEAYNKGVYDFASQVSAIRKAAEKASVDKMLNENTSESEEKFNVSESGKTIYKDADVNIESVVSVEGGNVKVKLDNGETVSASDLSFSTAEEAAMYNMIARMPVTPDTANELLSAFKPTNSSESLRYMTGVPLAYKFGKIGYEEGLKYIKLSEEQKRTVYNLGRIDAKLEAKTNTPSTTKSKSQNAAPTNKKGIIFEKGVTYDEASANDLQKSSMVVIEAIDAITNLEVHVFESKLENGERVYYLNGKREAAPNGFFRDGNKIYIDLNAGDKGEGAMLYTMAHEVTHYIRKWNAKGFKELADFLIEQYGKKGVPVNALIEEQIAKIKRRYERDKKSLPSEAKLYDMAYEEMVADAMSDMFADEKAFEKLIKLKQQNKSLWKKLGEAIKHLLDKIKATIGLYSKNDTPVAQEAYFVREFAPDVYNKLQDLYLKAFVEADENYGATIGSSDIVGIDTTTESVSPVMLSERTWTESEYVTMRDEAANKIAKALGVTKAKALKYIDDVNSIAKMIANDRARLDYEASSFGSAFVSNVEYGGSFDYTTLCKKRRIYTGTFTEIQKRLKDTALTPDDILTIRNMLIEAGVEATCGLCYVEGSRANMGKFAKEFIRLYKRDNPLAWIPNMADVNTPDGVEQMRISHPEAYEQYVYFWNHYGKLKDSDPALFASQQKPKLYEARKEYKGEILEHFEGESSVSKKNLNGGIRMQSFSDFEIVHLIDTMQVIMDMSTVGLAGQAYTKVPEFAKAFGNTGLKINLSLIAKGVDANGNLILDDREGMPHETAFELRERYSKNVGTIIVVFTDEQLLAAMADSRIDFIIPFHRSQWKKGQYGAMGLPKGTKDYTFMQNEKLIKQTYHEYRGKMVKDKASNYMPNEYWDFSKSGKENAEAYLKMCAENNKRPKFYKFLDYDGKGTYSLKADGSTDGYWKLLIDFKMYDNEGVGSPQQAVTPTFNMDEARTMLDEYQGGHSKYPVASSVVDKFVKEYESKTKTKHSDDDTQFSDRDSEGNTLSKEQQEFFKDSKVRDKKGNIKVLYHGTTANFNTFKKGDVGFHFGTKGAARGRVGFGKNVTLKEVYLNITNPIVFDEDLGSWDADYELAKKLYSMDILTRAEAESVLFTDNKLYRRSSEEANKKLSALLQSKGYDGIAYTNTHEGKKDSTSYIVFNSNQAKEITNKTPTSDSDIRYSMREIVGDSGKNYGIGVYLDSQLLSNLSDAERIEMVKEYVKELGGSVFTAYDSNHKAVDVHIVESNRRFKNKSGRKVSVYKDLTNYLNSKVKQEAIALVDELIFASTYRGTEPALHPHDWVDNNGANDWDVWTTYLQDKENTVWEAKLRIANSQNGEKILYDIFPIEMVEQSRTMDTSTTANSISQDSEFVNSEFSDIDEMHSDRGSNTISNRTLLANALESTAKNDVEKAKLEQYKKKIALIESEQAKLDKNREEAKELRFKKGRIPSETNRLRELDAEATQLKNRISTYDKQLLNLESTTALKNVLEREKTMVRKRTEQKGKEALRRQKEKAAETQRELMTRYQESRQKAVEGRNKTAMRHKIKNVVSDLNKLLLNPTKEQHVPIGLQLVVAEALDAINMDTMNAEERVAYYNDLIAKSSDPDEIAMLTKKRDFFEYRDANFKERITALKNAYAEFKESDDPLIRNAHNEAIENLIKNVADEIGNKSLKDMSLAQLEAVYDMYKAVLATVRNSNKMFKEGRQATVSENSESVKTEVREVGGHKDRINKHTKGIKSFTWNLLKPIYALQRIGSNTLTKLFDNVRAGEDTYAVDIYEAREFFQDKDNKYNYSKWDFKKRYSFKDSAGNDFTLSLEQIMSLYAYSKREQADQHLEVGGFVFDDAIEVVEKKLGIPMKYEVNDATPYRLRKEDLATVTNSLTPEQKGFVDEMQTYLSEVMGAKGNEVSLAMYDIKLYNETEYFPLKTSRYFREFDPETSGTPKLRNSGFSKKTVPNAGNPIVLSNFMDVWTSHVNDMSMYHAFVLPLEDFMRVYNYSSTAGGYDSVQQYIKNAYGVQANQYMEKLIQDINGGVISGNLRNGWLKMFNTFKKVTVGASLSTIVQQPTAVIRAMAIINPKYFLGVPFKGSHKKIWNEIKKYAPVAIIKEMGGFDVGSGRQAQDFITSRTYKGFSKVKGFFTDSSYRDSIFMWGATKADEFGWNTIWKAVKREVASKQNLKPGTEEFFKACGERFTEVVNQTQVYDSVFSRSGHMRDKGDLSKFATSFLGEPTTSFNMIYNAVLQAVRGGSKAQSIRVISSVYASIIGAAAMASLIYALRDDDEDEAYLEKWAEAFGNKLSTEIWIHNMIPYIRDIASILEGWDVERPDMSIFSDIKSSFDKLFEINEEGEFEWKVDFSDPKSVYSAIENFGGSIAAAFGLPLKNIMRDTRGIFNGIEAMFDDIHPKDVGGAFIEGFTGKEKDKSESLYEAIINGDKGRLEVYRESYKSDEAYESAVKSALRENDPRIKEAAKAKHKGDISKYTRIAKDIISEGNFSQDIVVGAINAEINALKKAEAPENDENEDKDEATSIYKASDISIAFDNGDTALAKEIINDLVDTKVANGMTEKEAKSSLRSSMTSYWKPLYKQAYNSGNASEMARIRQILYSSGLYGTANDVVKSTQNWLKD